MPDASGGVDVLFVRRGGAGVDPAHGLIDGADVACGWIAEADDGAEAG